MLFQDGDFNSKVSSAVSDECVIGRFGLGELTDRGERLKDVYQLLSKPHFSNTTLDTFTHVRVPVILNGIELITSLLISGSGSPF